MVKNKSIKPKSNIGCMFTLVERKKVKEDQICLTAIHSPAHEKLKMLGVWDTLRAI
ncbi:hypothetical protein KI387_013703, partial [Taxus chinensis]